jgi:hypothetical protein
MKTTTILRPALLLSAALTIGFATAASAGGYRVPDRAPNLGSATNNGNGKGSQPTNPSFPGPGFGFGSNPQYGEGYGGGGVAVKECFTDIIFCRDPGGAD